MTLPLLVSVLPALIVEAMESVVAAWDQLAILAEQKHIPRNKQKQK